MTTNAMSWMTSQMDSYEGELLRRSVLIRNAVKTASKTASLMYSASNVIASTSISTNTIEAQTASISTKTPRNNPFFESEGDASTEYNQEDQNRKADHERWVLMVSRAGLHPCDQLLLDDNDDDEKSNFDEEEEEADGYSSFEGRSIRNAQIYNYDYSSSEDDLNDGRNEDEWFQGLLQEVSAEQDGKSISSSLNAVDERISKSTASSLPSLVVDYEDDDGSSGEEDEAKDIIEQPRESSMRAVAKDQVGQQIHAILSPHDLTTIH